MTLSVLSVFSALLLVDAASAAEPARKVGVVGVQTRAKRKANGGVRVYRVTKDGLVPDDSKTARTEAAASTRAANGTLNESPNSTTGVSQGESFALGGRGISRAEADKSASANKSVGSASGSAAPAPAAAPAAPPRAPTPSPGPSGGFLSVTCGATQNVIKWKLLNGRNSNSLLRSVNGASTEYVCGGPSSIAPCTNLNVNIFVDRNVSAGRTYAYTHKSKASCASNTVTCPGGASTGEACTTGGIDGPASGTENAGSGGGGGGAPDDFLCTGGNPQCICVKKISSYRSYNGVAATATQAAFPGLANKPDGMSDGDATAAICAAYNANKTLGPGSECRSQNDEIVLQDPNPQNPSYPTVSLDVITSAGAFWAKPIAACAIGVQ